MYPFSWEENAHKEQSVVNYHLSRQFLCLGKYVLINNNLLLSLTNSTLFRGVCGGNRTRIEGPNVGLGVIA